MATKDYNLSSKNKQNLFDAVNKNPNGQYSNLNLNQGYHQSTDAFIVSSKSVGNESREVPNYVTAASNNVSDFTVKNNPQTNKHCISWNKSNTNLSSNFHSEKEQQINSNKSNGYGNKNSTLSLHITAYENSVEAAAADSVSAKKKLEKSDIIKNWKNAKQNFHDLETVQKNSFEFPRQQESSPLKPEIAQFKASQRLFNPNQSSNSNTPRRNRDRNNSRDRNFDRHHSSDDKSPSPPLRGRMYSDQPMHSSRNNHRHSPDRHRSSSNRRSSGGSRSDHRRSDGSYNRTSSHSRSRSPTDYRRSDISRYRRQSYDRSPDRRRSTYDGCSGGSQEDYRRSSGSMKRRRSYSSDSSSDAYAPHSRNSSSRRSHYRSHSYHQSSGGSEEDSRYDRHHHSSRDNSSRDRHHHSSRDNSSRDRHHHFSRDHSDTPYYRPPSNYPSSSGRPVYQKGHSAFVTSQQTPFSSSTPQLGNQNYRGHGYRGGRGGHIHRGGGGGRGPGSRKAADDDSEIISIQPVQNDFVRVPDISIPFKDELKTVVNAFEIATDRGIPVYQYAIKWKGVKAIKRQDENNHGKEIEDLNTQTKALQKLHTKQLALFSVFEKLLQDHTTFFGYAGNEYDIVYDSGGIFYAHRNIMDNDGPVEFDILVDDFPQAAKDYFFNIASVKAVISLVGKIDPKKLNGDPKIDRPIIQYLSIVFNQEQRKRGDYYCFDNEFFEKKSSEQIPRSPIVLKSGGFRSIRSTEDPSILTYHFVPKKTAFYGDFDLIKLIEFETQRCIDDIWKCFDVATKTIKNLIVKTNHLNNNRTFNVQGLTESPADVQTFELNGEPITVAEHYLNTYKRRLQRPDFPCVIGNNDSYYPFEVLEIVELQRIPKAKQDEFQHLKIADKCSFTPLQNLKAIEEERHNSEFLNSNEFIKKTGCRVYPRKLVSASAKQFYPPSIVLKDTQRKLNNGSFGMLATLVGDKFHQPAIVSKLACVIASRNIDQSTARDFFLVFIKHLKIYGVKIDHFEFFEWQNGSAECDKLLEYEKDGYKYAIIIGHEDDLHHGMKFMELKMNMVTQHIMCDTAAKPNYSVLDNLAFKFNLRAGGINWSLKSDPRMIEKFANVDLLQHLMKNTMLFGIDLSHPSWLNKNNASCVGFASNTMKGQSSICKGDFGYQAPRQTFIDQELLADKFKSAIKTYYLKSGCYPSWIVVYRAGVSEGEIPKVQEKEVSVMKKVMEEFKNQNPEFQVADVKLTVILSNEDTNYRLFKEEKDMQPASENLPSGTRVSEKIVSHKLPTFILISQLPKINKETKKEETLKPRVYSVLEGAGVVPFDHLQYLTYCLCFSHQICTSPTALPGPLESASHLSKRASNNLRYFLQKNPTFVQSYGTRESDESKKKYDCPPPEYFKDLNEELKAKIDWA